MNARQDELGKKNFQYPRSVRVAERIQAELASLLIHGVKDPRVRNVVITRVEVTPDLRTARAYFTSFGENAGDEAEIESVQEGLERAKGFLQSKVASQLQLKRAPSLAFHVDSGLSEAKNIDRLLQGLRKENRAGEES